jgi:hypothetical protein
MVVMALVVMGWPAGARAATIEYEAVDLADGGLGDRWEYRYFVSDISFAVDEGFSVYFPLGTFADLADPPASVGPDWDALSVQPDAVLSSDGFYDALALASVASLASPFVVQFDWLGAPGSQPGSQSFTINRLDPSGGLVVLVAGRTIPRGAPSVPEPAGGLLMLVGLATARRLRRRRSPSERRPGSGLPTRDRRSA